jgi:hypothetical protein
MRSTEACLASGQTLFILQDRVEAMQFRVNTCLSYLVFFLLFGGVVCGPG